MGRSISISTSHGILSLCTDICRGSNDTHRLGGSAADGAVNFNFHDLALDDLRLLFDAHADGFPERLRVASFMQLLTAPGLHSRQRTATGARAPKGGLSERGQAEAAPR